MYLLMLAVGCADKVAPLPAAPETKCDVDELGLELAYAPGAPVEVLTDERGVRHLYASSDQDLFWAAGYQIASDRLFQLDTFLRLAKGTLAEVQGEDQYEADLTARTFAFGRHACESVAWMTTDRPEDMALVVAYVNGVNARIAQVNAGEVDGDAQMEALGYGPTPWTLEDVFTIGRRINLGYSSSIEYDLLYGLMQTLVSNASDFPVFAPGTPRFITTDTAPEAAARPAPRGARRLTGTLSEADAERLFAGLRGMRKVTNMGPGSNNWAVSGALTDNGRPIIANDPHAVYNSPNTLWQVHLNSMDAGGAFDVAGFAFPGVPGVQLGHNRHLAWAATTAMADQTDMWAVEIDDGVAMLGGEEVLVTEEQETIRVKLADGSVEERVVTIQRIDGYGVIMPEDLLPLPPENLLGGQLLVNWVGFGPTDEFFTFLDFDRAEDLDDFEAAVTYQKVGLHNWVGATADGIRYKVHGLLPDRGEPGARSTPNQVMDGADASTFWNGDYLDEDKLPYLDGTQPFIVTANNDPFGHTDDNDPLNDTFYYSSFFAPSYRADRIHSELTRLSAEGPLTAEQMRTLQLDSYSSLAAGLVPKLTDAVSRIDTSEDLADFRERADLLAAAERLAAWDFVMSRDSEEAALFRAWEGYVSRKTLRSDLTILFDAVEEAQAVAIAKINLITYDQQVASILGDNADYYLLDALDEALAWVETRKAEEGLATWTWADAHKASFEPVYGEPTLVEVDGDDSAVNVSQCAFWDGGDPAAECVAPEGAIFRQVTTFDEDGTPVMEASVPYGGDGDVTRWQDGTYDFVPFARAEVEAAAVETTTIGE